MVVNLALRVIAVLVEEASILPLLLTADMFTPLRDRLVSDRTPRLRRHSVFE